MKSMSKVSALREAVSTITKVLAERDIKVTQRGTEAKVMYNKDSVPIEIRLPFIPDSASDELLSAIQGYLDHEVAHVLFTDDAFYRSTMIKGGIQANLLNIIEDIRIEKLMSRRFRGSREHLGNVANYVFDKMLSETLTEMLVAGCDNPIEFFKLLVVPAFRAFGDQSEAKQYMQDKWALVQPIIDKIGSELLNEIAELETCEETLDFHRRLIEKLNEPEQDHTPEGRGEKGDSKDQDKGEESDKTDEGKKSTSSDKSKDEETESSESEGGEDSSDESSDGESSGKSDEEPKEDDAPSEGSDGDSEGDDQDTDDTGDSEGEGQDADDSEEEEDSHDDSEGEEGSDSDSRDDKESDQDEDGSEGSDNGDEETDVDESTMGEDSTSTMLDDLGDLDNANDMTGKAISKEISDLTSDAPYVVYTTDFDVVENFKPKDSRYEEGGTYDTHVSNELLRLDTKAREQSGVMQKTLERLIVGKSANRKLPGQRSGKVNASSLYRLKTGDDRVFSRKIKGESKDAAVSLFIDCSGSMQNYDRFENAMTGAYSMSNVLSKLNIAHEAIGFTTTTENDETQKEVQRMYEKGIYVSRYENIYMPIFKGFNERLGTDTKRRFAAAAAGGLRLDQNVDGESLLIAAERLLQRPESERYLIVLTDGEPCARSLKSGSLSSHLIESVEKVRNMNIKLFAIGIQHRGVSKFYPNHVIVNDVEEIPQAIVGFLRENLL